MAVLLSTQRGRDGDHGVARDKGALPYHRSQGSHDVVTSVTMSRGLSVCIDAAAGGVRALNHGEYIRQALNEAPLLSGCSPRQRRCLTGEVRLIHRFA